MYWITLVLVMWKFYIVDLFPVFGRVPRFLNQTYLLVISSLISYMFPRFSGFYLWIGLGIRSAWDIFAVLSPYGKHVNEISISPRSYTTLTLFHLAWMQACNYPWSLSIRTKQARESSTASPSQPVLNSIKATQQSAPSSTNANIQPLKVSITDTKIFSVI